ncbi:retrovirus-related Pol polyprotein from transposon 297 [Trichonephila clavipes]|uniref:Retrovirus-related Pol polyprotein from transposon 297 n=1 Tax=Trichonephila clavipes TaxID=2585209 RepID=A0A8X6T2N3_TRICX|nr:retrovirus-related Pol polyprotein from transposon 297 [Trichonephila clavipes]
MVRDEVMEAMAFLFASKRRNTAPRLNTKCNTRGDAVIEENPPAYIRTKLKRNKTHVTVNGQCIKALVDSGANFYVISEELRRQLNIPMFAETGPTLKTVAASGRSALKILVWNFFRDIDAVIDCRNEVLQLAETFPNTSSNELDFSLFSAIDYRIEANSSKKIYALNPDIQDANEALITDNKVLMYERKLSILESIMNVESGCCKKPELNHERRLSTSTHRGHFRQPSGRKYFIYGGFKVGLLANRKTKLHSGASKYAIGAVIVQVQGVKERPIVYPSKSVTAVKKNYSTTEKECLAVICAIGKFRPYLFGRRFTVVMDHHPLCWLANVNDSPEYLHAGP